MNEKEKYMHVAIKYATKAYNKGEIPVGAVIVRNNKILAKTYNKKEKYNNAVCHAEILAIIKACKKLKKWRLDDCDIYITMEPCMMCMGAIKESRIKNIYYGIKNKKYGYLESNDFEINKIKTNIEGNVLANESLQLLQNFFEIKRKK